MKGGAFEVSADNGDNYTTITNKSLINITNTGTQLRCRVTFSNADTQIDSLSILYK